MNESTLLHGGAMNTPVLKNAIVYKKATPATGTIHSLLRHVRETGLDWVPESFGLDAEGRHMLSFIPGEVPHDEPDWLWSEDILREAARLLRKWHDATAGFHADDPHWLLENDEPPEVICHNDFAPYNCVFMKGHITGVIDFDVCSPGSRLWDIAYTAYRFVPLFPEKQHGLPGNSSPFQTVEILSRLQVFLDEYNGSNSVCMSSIPVVLGKAAKRVGALAEWSRTFGTETGNSDICRDAEMYRSHAIWLETLCREMKSGL